MQRRRTQPGGIPTEKEDGDATDDAKLKDLDRRKWYASTRALTGSVVLVVAFAAVCIWYELRLRGSPDVLSKVLEEAGSGGKNMPGLYLDRRRDYTSDTVVNYDRHAQFISGLMAKDGKWESCKYYKGEFLTLCCSDFEGAVKCFPSAVGIGTQKSGSTIVFARLMVHPRVWSGDKKETHFFDFPDRWEKGPDKYMGHFPEQRARDLGRTLGIEYTPSYLLPAGSCRRLRHLLPHARLLVILRDPVERAWSEIQMKLRHDAGLKSFAAEVMEAPERQECFDGVMNDKRLAAKTVKTQVSKCFMPDQRSNVLYNSFNTRLVRVFKRYGRWNECREGAQGAPDPTTHLTACLLEPMRASIKLDDDADGLLDNLEREARELQECFSKNNGKCFGLAKKASDISIDNLYRGLYAHQLKECFRWFPRDQVLILENDELRSDPLAGMRSVYQHFGIKDHIPDVVDDDKAWELFRGKYPQFEEVTGWQHDAPVTEMPSEVREYLGNFYREPNRELEELLNRRLEWQGRER